ncbi:MAG TPA: peptidylprolyl isomerase [Vicinamibacterales bacterium]|nr:peptidylprolyl isomerase [Vicinamibacterales bacterium]
MTAFRFALTLVLLVAAQAYADQRGAKPSPAKPAPPKPAAPQFFTTPLTLDQMRNKQAVVETDLGTIVIDLLPEAAPNHVGYFMKNAQDGTYVGTTFHRVVRQGIVQGGDPLTKDPSKVDAHGTGGFGVLRAERNAEKNTRGAVSAVVGGGNPDSGGTQFFICVADQPGLDGTYDVFGRVSEGILVAQKISEAPADEKGRPKERIAIRSVTIRDTPAARPEPFSTESVAELSSYRVILETSMGPIALEFAPDKAPEHVRNFLRLAQAGVYNGMGIHRVAKGFVIQSGYLPSRSEPLSESQQRLVRNLQPEFNDIPHVKGTLSMARGDNPASADMSFFIVLRPSPVLDGKYTAFGRVVDGLPVVDAIEQVRVNGEAPVTRIEIKSARVEKRP